MSHTILSMPFTLPYAGISLPNRLVLAPMTTYSSNTDGTITDAEVDFLRRRAAGGIGTIITAACYVDPAGQGFVGQWGCSDDRFLPSLRRVAEAIHSEGAVALLQIHDAGRMSDPSVLSGPPRAPSAIASPRPGMATPRAMTSDEIHASIAAFGTAAGRAMAAGFDGVEIHGANTYLLQQFFSPHSNRRNDEWGGDLERRMRFIQEVIQSVRGTVGATAIVGYRFSPEEVEEPGITFEDTLELVDLLTELPLDYLHVSLGDYQQGSLRNPQDSHSLLKLIIDYVGGSMPIMAVGSITEPEQAVDALHQGAALVALGRVALYEPEWPRKVLAGHPLKLCLPRTNGANICTLPLPLYERLLTREGWIPLCDE